VFTGEGIDVQLGVNATAIDGTSGQGVRVRIDGRGGARTIEGSDILVAVGRTPNTRGIGLEEAGIALDAGGYIIVDDHLRARASGVWAMGECAGSPKFTHIAFDDFRIVRDDLAGGSRTKRGRLVPYCVFTDPELAHVGLDEMTARRDGIRVRVGRLPMSSVLRAHAIGEMLGFMKILVAADGDRILGFTMLGADAGEVCSVVATAMAANMPFTALRDAILPHPTMAEGLAPLLSTLAA
jgi:pyruvate/2-oxoglutarate dehydrogenase complex dihydrolipoamide dehydrogenase (E3) component